VFEALLTSELREVDNFASAKAVMIMREEGATKNEESEDELFEIKWYE